MTRKLSDIVSIVPRFQRASRIDSDRKAANIGSIVVTETHRQVLEFFARNSGAGAFILTGAYGSGKSTLCLLLSSLMAEARQKTLSEAARSAIGKREADRLRKRILGEQPGLKTVAVIGRHEQASQAVREAMIAEKIAGKTIRKTPQATIEGLKKAIAKKKGPGILLIIDEMGKFLEHAAKGNDDAIFLQELAELASRSEGRLLLLGILHQSFAAYADLLPEATKREWGKIHGRFRDIPLQLTRNEQISLLASAIQTSQLSVKTKQKYADLCKKLPKEIAEAFAGNSCYPLHPLTACLITDIASSGIGQNQRTLFSFIATGEQGGLREFLETGAEEGEMLEPAQLWRYISESSLAAQSGPVGHKYSVAQDCLEKAQKLGNPLCADIIRFLAVAWIFGRSSLQPTEKLIHSAFAPRNSTRSVNAALALLLQKSIIIKRKIDNRIIPYQGSDFDIEAALASIDRAPAKVYKPLGDRPVIAHRHAIQTGTLRYAHIYLLGTATKIPPAKEPIAKEFACLCLLLDGGSSPTCSDGRIVISATPENREEIRKHMQDLKGLESLLEAPEVAGDAVARNEIRTRIEATSSRLNLCIDQAIENAMWKKGKERLPAKKSLSQLLSDQADGLFEEKKRIAVQNELINRHKPSSAARTATALLMELLLTEAGKERLGMTGWPAEAGIYESVVKSLGFHKKAKGGWKVGVPEDGNIGNLWAETKKMLVGKGQVEIRDIHRFWADAPFGMPEGLQPLLSFLFYLTNRDYLSIYINNVYQARMDSEWLIQNWMHTRDISLYWSDPDKMPVNTIEICRHALAAVGVQASGNCLEMARALVAWSDNLPAWTHANTSFSAKARKLLLQLRKARDPNSLLLEILPQIVGKQLVSEKSKKRQAQQALSGLLKEIDGAYASMLNEVRQDILRALREPANAWGKLKGRFEELTEVPGDLRARALIRRLCDKDSDENIEAILALAAGSAPDSFAETMIKDARIDLDAMLDRILTVELHGAASGKTGMVSIAMVGMNGAARPVVVEDLVGSREQKSIDALCREIEKAIKTSSAGMSRGAKLSALLKSISKHGTKRGNNA